MATASFLLGPSKLCYSSPLSTATTPTGNDPIKNLISQVDDVQLFGETKGDSSEERDYDSDDYYSNRPMMGFTENNSATFLSSGNPCLDFFFHVVPDTKLEKLIRWLESAWSHNSLTALKLVCNLRGVRGTGKSDKEGFYTVALWLHQHHPKILAGNVKVFAGFGYFKDLLEILYRILEGPSIRKTQKEEWESRLEGRKFSFRRRRGNLGRKKHGVRHKIHKRQREIELKRVKRSEERKAKILKNLEDVKLGKQKASKLRKEKEMNKARKVLDKYYLDEKFRLLYDMISDFFVELLKADLEKLRSGDLKKITLASKWCPSVDYSYDKATLMCENIARKMFPKENHSEYEGIEETHYAYRVRDRLRKEVETNYLLFSITKNCVV